MGPAGHSREAGATSDASDGAASGVLLDETAFPSFEALVLASKDYARLSGCRFRRSSFDGLPAFDGPFNQVSEPLVIGAQRSKDRGPLLRAKLKAAPVAAQFAQRLRSGQPALQQDLDAAFHMVMEESIRNTMIADFLRLGKWPPSPPPPGVDDGDCNYQDLTAPLDVIAQRTYNDAVSRATGHNEDGPDRRYRRAMTATFLIDFAHELGVELPPMMEAQQQRFQRFYELMEADAGGSRGSEEAGLGAKGRPAEDNQNILQFLAENKKAAALTAVGVLTIGPVATAGLFLARRAWQRRGCTPDSTSPLSCEASTAAMGAEAVEMLGPGYSG